jgi:hypothetical protein
MTQQPTIRQILEAPAVNRDRYTGATVTATADEVLARQSRAPLSTADLAASSGRPAESVGTSGSPGFTRPAETFEPTGSRAMTGALDEMPPASAAAAAAPAPSSRPAALFERNDSEQFRRRWSDVQAAFVDDPRQAVQQADGLVADLMQMLAKRFADEKGHLEADWSRGDDVSTEDLRVAFQHYRAFFDRLLSL